VKKLFVLIMMFVYSITAIGATINMHYCMGEFVEWNFLLTNKKNCSKCGMLEKKENNSCCKNEKKILKIDTQHNKSSNNISIAAPKYSKTITLYQKFKFINLYKLKITRNYFHHPPPDIANSKKYILNSVFLI
jgi:hypothetical protein